MSTYRVLAGIYATGKGLQRKVYGARNLPKDVAPHGDVIETDKDLLKFNHPGSMKFERIDDVNPSVRSVRSPSLQAGQVEAVNRPVVPAEQPTASPQASTTDDGYENMTLSDLRSYAVAEKIDISRAQTKAEILKAIRAADAAKSGM